MERAFAAGYDPALELAKHSQRKPALSQAAGDEELEWDLDEPWTNHLRRTEQNLIDRIVKGEEPGHYFVLLGPKVRTVASRLAASMVYRSTRTCDHIGDWEDDHDP